MKSLYIGKTLINGKNELIVTDGINFSTLPGVKTLDELLKLSQRDIFAMTNRELSSTFHQFSEVFLENQQVWGTGITFPWTEEKLSTVSDSDPYKKVYLSERPMFFYKGTKSNHSFMNDFVGMRQDSVRNIPEAELIAVFNQFGEIIGFTLGNDQTAISLEHENVLYQFQAKSFTKSHSFLPMINLFTDISAVEIFLCIKRKGVEIFSDAYKLKNFRENVAEISKYLFLSNKHENGVFLYLGFNLSYPPNFSLEPEDEIIISSPQFPIKLVQKSHLI